jgi:hypothetical protein
MEATGRVIKSCLTLRLYDTMLNFVENLLENERGPMNDQDLTKTDYDPDRSLVLIEGLSHFLTNFLQNLASCQTSFRDKTKCLQVFFFLIGK